MNKTVKELNRDWRLTIAPNREVKDAAFDPKTVAELTACSYQTIDASVPGNFELDLIAAGLAPHDDPYFAQNPLAFQQFENRHLWYATTFTADNAGDENTFLRFEGIDTVADIYLNGKLLGHTENMLIAHEFCVGGMLRAENELVVHIHPTVIVAREYPVTPSNYAQRYNYDALHIRKCASMFGWDIMPRFVSGGLWKPVKLVQKPRERIEQFALFTADMKKEPLTAKFRAFFELHTDEDFVKGLRLTVDAVCGDSKLHIDHPVWHTYGVFGASLADPKLWWPRNAGDQNLYDVTVRLWRDDVLCDERTFRFGIRTTELIRTSTTDKDGNGEFVFKINGKKVFCVGTNWVPLDAFPSRNSSRLAPSLEMLYDVGCNMVRCWGGNVYEDDAFYDYCDEHGIMVWQDFGMGCAIYPQDDAFAQKIFDEAVDVIKRLRTHASIVLWAGDNEVDIFYGRLIDPNTNRLTREVLPKALRENDIGRPYIPSSPYVDEEAFRTRKHTSEEHLWGPRDYFKGKFYGESVCHFASETGYHGCPSPASLKKFISEEQLWPMLGEDGNPRPDWICHATQMAPIMQGPYAYRIGIMAKQVKALFGYMPDTLSEFARLSQLSQAEANKFFIERFRLTKWRRTGILWWNLVDGWPQVSDAVVDWYHCKKVAYHYIKRSQAQLCIMFDEPRDGMLSLFAVNDTPNAQKLTYTVKDLTNGKTVASGEACVDADTSSKIVSIPAYDDYAFLYIEWTAEDGTTGNNHFITKTVEINAEQYLNDIRKVGYDQFEGFEEE